ncbi:unnamed protein product [Mytilus edulis]|uniref:Uncharacterized protein n=1 Tax=Mytilus edulis TaxID=6550 RepID=A0A8S3SF91_MYTED|nr:unnamed protein product [Mytilus edulis]
MPDPTCSKSFRPPSPPIEEKPEAVYVAEPVLEGSYTETTVVVYVNQLLDNLNESNIGGKIGQISCCAPTCADDIALLGNNPLDLQILVNIAFDYSQREGYLLQPEKSVVLPVLTSNKVTYEEEKWFMRDKLMPVVKKKHLTLEFKEIVEIHMQVPSKRT